MTVALLTVTRAPLAAIVSTVESSLDFLITIFLLATAETDSEKVSTRFELAVTPVASSAGDKVLTVGAVVSAIVKLNAVVLDIPAYAFPDASLNAPLSTNT